MNNLNAFSQLKRRKSRFWTQLIDVKLFRKMTHPFPLTFCITLPLGGVGVLSAVQH